MNKEELLKELSAKIDSGEISRDEVQHTLKLEVSQKTSDSETNSKKANNSPITKVLYLLGAAIVVIGITIFISQIGEQIGSFGRVGITLGLGLVLLSIGCILVTKNSDTNIGSVFMFIGSMFIPGGALVALEELGIDTDSGWPLAITFGFIFGIYLLLNYLLKNVVLSFFSIANGTAFVYLFCSAFFENIIGSTSDLFAYITIFVGIGYLLLARQFKNGWNKDLASYLNFFGISAFLGGTFSQVFENPILQVLYFLVLIASISLSIYIKSRSILIVSVLFLLSHITYITARYFSGSIGWPVALVILGFIFIGLGYMSVNINKKYIAK